MVGAPRLHLHAELDKYHEADVASKPPRETRPAKALEWGSRAAATYGCRFFTTNSTTHRRTPNPTRKQNTIPVAACCMRPETYEHRQAFSSEKSEMCVNRIMLSDWISKLPKAYVPKQKI